MKPTKRRLTMLAFTPADWANIIRDRRIDLGLSQKTLGEQIGMSRQWIVRFENGHAAVATVEHIVRLAEALALDIDIDVAASGHAR